MPTHQMNRVRHGTRRRTLTVDTVEQLTPSLRRIHFVSRDLRDFVSEAPDDHIKLFLPLSCDSEVHGPSFCMRDYTPRKFDTERGMLTIDFALHETGPATSWARMAQPGDTVEIGGPRGSNVVSDDFDWYLLIGDETALPAVGRRVEELRPGVPVTTLVMVNDSAEKQHFSSRAALTSEWLYRAGQSVDDAKLFELALSALTLPKGDGYVWIAAETTVARIVRQYVSDHLGHPKEWIKASGYWTQGLVATHEKLQA
jgi:NADPH-dependent ferric siderophore reductase